MNTDQSSEKDRGFGLQGRADLAWLTDELQNLLFLAERAEMHSTARDLRFAIRSAEVELRQAPGQSMPVLDCVTRISRDDGRPDP